MLTANAQGFSSGRPNRLRTFSVTFDGAKQEHAIQVEFIRDSASAGSGLRMDWTPTPATLMPEALDVAKKSDLVNAMLGLSPDLEGEEMPVKLRGFASGDRTDISLPASQRALLGCIVATGKPTIVVLLTGSALAINMADDKANAIPEAWYPGEAGSTALADTLMGKNNPSGRLPVTFYESE